MPCLHRHRAVLALLLVAAAVLAGCGNKKAVQTEGSNEGTYIDVGPLIYQVQVSRQLNPRNTEDHAYLAGLPAGERQLKPDEVWFAVFVRVQNNTKHPARSSDDFRVLDTEDREFTPIPLASINDFAYHPAVVPAGGLLPRLGTVAAYGPVQQGSLLLFKLTLTSLGNRPLELKVFSSGAPRREGTVQLDV